MATVSIQVVMAQLLAVLREAFEGPKESWSYFTDSGPEAGFFGKVERLGAANASQQVGGASIAAHAHHVAFALEASSAWIKGDRSHRNWAESWSVQAVDDAGWARLLERLRAGYGDLRRAIEEHALSSEEAAGGAIAALAHAAYHLGAIQQKTTFAAMR